MRWLRSWLLGVRRCRRQGLRGLAMTVRRKSSSFEDYWLASKAWERKGLPLGTARALANAGYLTVEDLQSVPLSELAAVPRVGQKSLTILMSLCGGGCPDHSTSRGSGNQQTI